MKLTRYNGLSKYNNVQKVIKSNATRKTLYDEEEEEEKRKFKKKISNKATEEPNDKGKNLDLLL